MICRYMNARSYKVVHAEKQITVFLMTNKLFKGNSLPFLIILDNDLIIVKIVLVISHSNVFKNQ